MNTLRNNGGSIAASLLMLILALAVVAVVQSIQVDGSGVPNSAQSIVRQKRGFRNQALSTARGFGKRVSSGSLSPAAAELLGELPFDSFDNSNRAIPASWLAEQVTRSPALAKLIVEKAVDVNGDGMISQEELYQAL